MAQLHSITTMRSSAYWVRRAAALEAALIQKADKAAERIAELYNKALGDINRDKNKILRELERLAANRGLTEEEYLRQYINVDKTSYPDLVKLLNETDDTRTRAEILTRMDSMAYGARISRLEEVQMRIYLRIAEAAKAEQSIQKKLYKDILQGAYYENINTLAKGYNVGIDFSLLPSRAIDAALKEPWRGGNYSSRIWSKSAAFEKKVEETVVNGLLTGKSHYISAKSLNEYTDFGDYATRRLVRTETAHFMGIGQLEAYDAAGIDKYRFIAALSERTCGSCADLDGQVFERSQAREGENYPPIHPNCRCITVTADADLKTRKARDPFTGGNYNVRGDMTYNEWINSFEDIIRSSGTTNPKYDKKAGLE